VESFVRPVPGSPGRVTLDEQAVLAAIGERAGLVPAPDGWEVPPDFDREAMQARFDRLAKRLGEVYGTTLGAGAGPAQDASYFGEVVVPADLTRTRAKRTGVRHAVAVTVSNFGGLVAVRTVQTGPLASPPPVDPRDRDRIEPVVTGLGFHLVPGHILGRPCDGPNARPDSGWTWHERFFGHS
jgi:hypothetical protein